MRVKREPRVGRERKEKRDSLVVHVATVRNATQGEKKRGRLKRARKDFINSLNAAELRSTAYIRARVGVARDEPAGDCNLRRNAAKDEKCALSRTSATALLALRLTVRYCIENVLLLY